MLRELAAVGQVRPTPEPWTDGEVAPKLAICGWPRTAQPQQTTSGWVAPWVKQPRAEGYPYDQFAAKRRASGSGKREMSVMM